MTLEEVAGQGAVCVASDGAATGSDDFDWRKAAINLAMREADYRLNHDVHGDGSLEAGRSWDRMRHSGDAIRAAALRIHPAKDDARALLVEALKFYAQEWEQDCDAQLVGPGVWDGGVGDIEPTEALRNDGGKRARAAIAYLERNP